MFNLCYATTKKQVQAQLANATHFEVRFTTPCTVKTLTHCKAGQIKKFKRKANSNYFLLNNSKIVVTATTIAHILAHKQGHLAVTQTFKKS